MKIDPRLPTGKGNGYTKMRSQASLYSWNQGRFVSLQPGTTTIGREETSVKFVKDKHLSRQHCALTRMPSGATRLRDLGSSNGTLVNDVRIESNQEIELREGDWLRIGEQFLYVTYSQTIPQECPAIGGRL